MKMNEPMSIDPLLAGLPEDGEDLLSDDELVTPAPTPAPAPAAPPRRKLSQMMRKIPVTLTLEVGAARVSLDEVMNIQADSVIPLDTLAGEPLVIKVNGTVIGRAEVVVTGDKYGLKVVDVSGLDLDALET